MDRKIVIIADRRLNGVSDMREILFKAKRLDNGEWVEGDLLHTGHADVVLISDFKDQLFRCDGNTLCQYTGLTDKNGQKIWENDIVSAWSEGKNAIGKVIRRADGLYIMYPAYQNKEFWGLCPKKNGKTTVEVIGNVFDNADLLEVE